MTQLYIDYGTLHNAFIAIFCLSWRGVATEIMWTHFIIEPFVMTLTPCPILTEKHAFKSSIEYMQLKWNRVMGACHFILYFYLLSTELH